MLKICITNDVRAMYVYTYMQCLTPLSYLNSYIYLQSCLCTLKINVKSFWRGQEYPKIVTCIYVCSVHIGTYYKSTLYSKYSKIKLVTLRYWVKIKLDKLDLMKFYEKRILAPLTQFHVIVQWSLVGQMLSNSFLLTFLV